VANQVIRVSIALVHLGKQSIQQSLVRLGQQLLTVQYAEYFH